MSSFQSPIFRQYTIASVSDKLDSAKEKAELAAAQAKQTAQNALAKPASSPVPAASGVGLYGRFAFAGAPLVCCYRG